MSRTNRSLILDTLTLERKALEPEPMSKTGENKKKKQLKT
jgi:hypothetical protein